MTLTFSMTLKCNKVWEVVEVHVNAKFHQAECRGSWVHKRFLLHLEIVKNPKIQSSGLDLWPMTLTLSGFLLVVRAKCHQATCSGSWVILRTEKKLTKTLLSVATTDSKNWHSVNGGFRSASAVVVDWLTDWFAQLVIFSLPRTTHATQRSPP